MAPQKGDSTIPCREVDDTPIESLAPSHRQGRIWCRWRVEFLCHSCRHAPRCGTVRAASLATRAETRKRWQGPEEWSLVWIAKAASTAHCRIVRRHRGSHGAGAVLTNSVLAAVPFPQQLMRRASSRIRPGWVIPAKNETPGIMA